MSFRALAIATGFSLIATAAIAADNSTLRNPPPAGSNTNTAQEPGKAEEPKQYQPANPAPDPRAAPTSSSTGIGSSSGGRPEQQPAKK